MNRCLCFVVAALLLSACVSDFFTHYQGMAAEEVTASGRIITTTQEPSLTDYPKDVPLSDFEAMLFEDGYIMLGSSTFTGSRGSRDQALEQGKALGASLVAYGETYSHTTSGVTSSDRRVNDYNVNTGETTYRTVTDITPYSHDYYEYIAVYAAQYKHGGFDIMYTPLSAEQRQLLDSANGIVITAVRKGSNVDQANIVKGDIITEVNGSPVVYSVNAPYLGPLKLLQNSANSITIFRNGSFLSKEVYVDDL